MLPHLGTTPTHLLGSTRSIGRGAKGFYIIFHTVMGEEFEYQGSLFPTHVWPHRIREDLSRNNGRISERLTTEMCAAYARHSPEQLDDRYKLHRTEPWLDVGGQRRGMTVFYDYPSVIAWNLPREEVMFVTIKQ